MAHGFLQSLDPNLKVYSAGTRPAARVQPNSIRVMTEVKIDISHHQPTHVDQYIHEAFDYVITVCDGAKEICPVFTGTVRHRLHMGFDDPYEAKGTQEEILGEYRRVRNEIMSAFRQWYEGMRKE